MAVTIKEVTKRGELREFIFLPEKIHKDHKNWIPPLYMDEWDFYNPKKNRSLSNSSSILALAYNNNKEVVGRIMGIICHKHNEIHRIKTARFFNMECYDDPEVASALIKFIENWAIGMGMTRLVGPLGFSDKDPQGLLIEGFDQPVVITSNCNREYMVRLIENKGFSKEVDLVAYKTLVPKTIPAFYKEIRERTLQRNDIHLLEFTSKKALRPYIKPIFHLINSTYKEIYGFSEIESGEMDYLVSRYMPVINPRFVKIVASKAGELIAFVLAMPDIAEGIRLAKGRLFPTGIIKIITTSRRTRLLVMLLGAIKDEYRNSGLDALMGMRIIEEAQALGMEIIDSHLIMENNVKMRAEYERMGGEVYKRYRIYQKDLVLA
jgi:GNAT superfamily N-acetyltransferase